MKLILAGQVPYTAAKRAQISPRQMYRSRLYKMWQSGEAKQLAELKEELDLDRVVARNKPLAGGKALQ